MRLYVRPIKCHGEGDTRFRGSQDQIRGFLANRDLCTYISEHHGGMYGDWAEAGLIPDVPPLDLADLMVDEWVEWRIAMNALRVGRPS